MRNALPHFKHWLYLIPAFLIGLSGCIPSIVADSTYDRSVDFQIYRTFALMEPEMANTSADPNLYEPLLDRRVRDAIAAELVKKGMLLDVENPDLLVAYDVSVAQDAATASPDFGYAYWFGYRFNYNSADFPGYRPVAQYIPGTMLIDLISSSTNELVWRGVAEGDINVTQTDESRIRRSIISILSQYPPNRPASSRPSSR
ncbi:DUF4136 domain-containing protein [Pontibacter lucknowensis]|uniref:DUF4136 domain-containing protein n=1 Tax=Pontibacter lucknowensis TaxID=1077936 RepID=A0A1N6V5Y0_9BACT|nr:DUF4136 domain-containing protein [Pontibacter lucknowensis]SIQ73159.1 protein of unknown function [Pontibacter lucknowensis]